MFLDPNWFLTANSPIDLIKIILGWKGAEEEFRHWLLLSICNSFLHRTFCLEPEEDKMMSFQNHNGPTDRKTVSSCAKIPVDVFYEPKNIRKVRRSPGRGWTEAAEWPRTIVEWLIRRWKWEALETRTTVSTGPPKSQDFSPCTNAMRSTNEQPWAFLVAGEKAVTHISRSSLTFPRLDYLDSLGGPLRSSKTEGILGGMAHTSSRAVARVYVFFFSRPSRIFLHTFQMKSGESWPNGRKVPTCIWKETTTEWWA